MRVLIASAIVALAGAMSVAVVAQGKPVDVAGTMTFRCAFGGGCAEGDAMVGDGGVYQEDPSQDTFVSLSKEGRLQFRLSNENGSRSLFMNLKEGVDLCSARSVHCYWHDYPGIGSWVSTFGRDGGQATVVNASGSDVKNGLNSLAEKATANGRFVVNWDDPVADMRWGLAFRGADQELRIRRDTGCSWTIYAESGAATAVLSAWPKIKRAYTEVPQARFDMPFSLTFSTCAP